MDPTTTDCSGEPCPERTRTVTNKNAQTILEVHNSLQLFVQTTNCQFHCFYTLLQRFACQGRAEIRRFTMTSTPFSRGYLCAWEGFLTALSLGPGGDFTRGQDTPHDWSVEFVLTLGNVFRIAFHPQDKDGQRPFLIEWFFRDGYG